MTLVLMHGWGFDADFWQPLRDALPEVETVVLDLGFTGRPRTEIPPGPAVAIGHSLGFPWLLRQLRNWSGLVAINGFPRFTRAPDFPHGTPPRVLDRMRARFAEEPETVHRDFMARLFPLPAKTGLDAARMSNGRLAEGLAWLADWDERAALAAVKAPLLALAAADDPLIPEAMTRHSFPAEALRVRADGGHVLPVTHPEWCAEAIREFLR